MDQITHFYKAHDSVIDRIKHTAWMCGKLSKVVGINPNPLSQVEIDIIAASGKSYAHYYFHYATRSKNP